MNYSDIPNYLMQISSIAEQGIKKFEIKYPNVKIEDLPILEQKELQYYKDCLAAEEGYIETFNKIRNGQLKNESTN